MLADQNTRSLEYEIFGNFRSDSVPEICQIWSDWGAKYNSHLVFSMIHVGFITHIPVIQLVGVWSARGLCLSSFYEMHFSFNYCSNKSAISIVK